MTTPRLLTVLFLAIPISEPGLRSQQCMDLPGTAYVVVPPTPLLAPTSGLTIEAWVRINGALAPSSYWKTIVRRNPQPNNETYTLRVDGTTLRGVVHVLGLGGEQINAGYVPPDEWHHCAVTYDGLTVVLFLDGVVIGQNPAGGPIFDTGGEFRIGAGEGVDQNFPGQIDEVRVWSVGRTPAQIQADMSRKLVFEPGLIALWHLDGNLLDGVGNLHGSAVGTVSYVVPGAPLSGAIYGPPAMAIGTSAVFAVLSGEYSSPYIFDVSLSGSLPGTPLPPPLTGTIPITPPLLHLEYGPAFPQFFQNFFGLTDASGAAYPILNIPAQPWLAGQTLTSCYVTLRFTGYPIGEIGNAVQTTLTL